MYYYNHIHSLKQGTPHTLSGKGTRIQKLQKALEAKKNLKLLIPIKYKYSLYTIFFQTLCKVHGEESGMVGNRKK
jgi:hypothetical protein